MTNSKALIERLRDYGDGDYVQNHHDRIEAADHIEKLEADNARLREEIMLIEVDAMEHYHDWMEHGCEPVEATRFVFDLSQYARAALQETSDDC